MKRVLTAVVLIPVVLLIVFKAPLWLFALVVAAIIVLALHEYLGIVEAASIKPFRRLTYAAGVLPILVFLYKIVSPRAIEPDRYFSIAPEGALVSNWYWLALLSPLIFGIPLVLRKDLRGGLASASASVFGVFYIGASLSTLVLLGADVYQSVLVIFVLFSVWAGDIAAYYVGKNFGQHRLAPVVSPNKSWEGAIASVLASVALAFLVMRYRYQLMAWLAPEEALKAGPDAFQRLLGHVSAIHTIALGLVTNVAAQYGDLFESALKRGAGVKDSGTLLPGHGGILDRIDALLFAIPVVWYYANLTRFLLH
jgi:phosphatidate cytidylyltransferase